jgi:hypothetical protein
LAREQKSKNLPILGEPSQAKLVAKMRRKLKVVIARQLARRLEVRARRLRRSLRDYDRVQWREIHAAELAGFDGDLVVEQRPTMEPLI